MEASFQQSFIRDHIVQFLENGCLSNTDPRHTLTITQCKAATSTFLQTDNPECCEPLDLDVNLEGRDVSWSIEDIPAVSVLTCCCITEMTHHELFSTMFSTELAHDHSFDCCTTRYTASGCCCSYISCPASLVYSVLNHGAGVLVMVWVQQTGKHEKIFQE